MNKVAKVTNGVVKAPARGMSDALMQLITDPNVPIEKLDLLLKMQHSLLVEQRQEAFQADYVLMQAEMPQVDKRGFVELGTKDGVRRGSYRYAKFEDMDTVLKPIYTKHGFSLSFCTRIEGTQTILVGKLLHRSGHFETAEKILLADRGPGRNDMQAEGSGITYQKRYIAEMLLNIVRRDIDDDAISAMQKKISHKQMSDLVNLIGHAQMNVERFLKVMVSNCERLEDVPERDYGRLVNALNDKVRALQNKA
jgi:hypothetical protein